MSDTQKDNALRMLVDGFRKDIATLRAQNAKLREALERLANNNLSGMDCASVELAGKRVANIARAVLEETTISIPTGNKTPETGRNAPSGKAECCAPSIDACFEAQSDGCQLHGCVWPDCRCPTDKRTPETKQAEDE